MYCHKTKKQKRDKIKKANPGLGRAPKLACITIKPHEGKFSGLHTMPATGGCCLKKLIRGSGEPQN